MNIAKDKILIIEISRAIEKIAQQGCRGGFPRGSRAALQTCSTITTSRELFVKGQPVLARPLVDASSCFTVFSMLAGPQALCCKNL